MADSTITNAERKKDWVLSQAAFHRLLEWLDDGAPSGGETYLEMRRRLVAYFDRKNCHSPDELADETLNRVARRLYEEGGADDTPPARYCYIVARFIFLEYLRRGDRRDESLSELSGAGPGSAAATESNNSPIVKERLLDCLERCLETLDADSRDLISQYYRGEQRAKIENRRLLAGRLGLTMNAVSIRACRIRDKLEKCVRQCSAD